MPRESGSKTVCVVTFSVCLSRNVAVIPGEQNPPIIASSDLLAGTIFFTVNIFSSNVTTKGW